MRRREVNVSILSHFIFPDVEPTSRLQINVKDVCASTFAVSSGPKVLRTEHSGGGR